MDLVRRIERAGSKIGELDEHDLSSSFKAALAKSKVHPAELIYINWYRFNAIDEMRFSDFVTYFDDVWYPAADDIDVFDSSCLWFLSISHNGVVRQLALGVKPLPG